MAHKIGKVSYINSLPLFCAEAPKGFCIVPECPANLNALAMRGALDASLVSLWIYKNIEKNYRVIPEYCIAGDGEIMSVKIFSKCELSELRGKTIYITPETDTSSRAFRFLILQKFGVDIFELARADIDCADAVLLIGNAALGFDSSAYAHVFDLGAMWKDIVGLPMIYAVFVARRDVYDAVAPSVAEYAARSLAEFAADKSACVKRAAHMFEEAQGRGISESTLSEYYGKLIYKLPPDVFEKSFNFVKAHGY